MSGYLLDCTASVPDRGKGLSAHTRQSFDCDVLDGYEHIVLLYIPVEPVILHRCMQGQIQVWL